ncbi:hypothetical protein [Microbulbifer sp. ZKSA002]|uniref:hypothetical protein n=1 Tax=Microbulbifer sp. ZKSA002 TaxID=3243388 RepID=UPI00403946D4
MERGYKNSFLNTANKALIKCFILTCMCLALGCDNSGSDSNDTPKDTTTASESLLAQFGDAQGRFSKGTMQALLEYEDTSNTLALVQLIAVSDTYGFSNYESSIESVWSSVGGGTVFASTVAATMFAEREFSAIRIAEFPNIDALLEAINSEDFTTAINTLYGASTDQTWILGIPGNLPFEPSGSFSDPSLDNLDEDEAIELLLNTGVLDDSGEAVSLYTNIDVMIDMIVSDSPSPFFMMNLIDFYETAQYSDGRETELTGEEANSIYGETIGLILFSYNSGPTYSMDVDIVLTEDTIDWEKIMIVRYASRDAFLNAFLNPAAREALEHKEAGLENTFVYVTELAETGTEN